MDEMSFDTEREAAGERPERAPSTAGGMALHDLEALLSDIDQQPDWRDAANKASQYYDGKQLTSQRIQEMADSKEPATVVNLVAGAINGVLGQEAKTRLDWQAACDSDAFQEVADVMNQKLTQAKRETQADLAISDAYKGQIVPGIGWVEVGRHSDPLEFPYKVKSQHRNQVWWDWRAKEADLSDARWQCKQAWVDLDLAQRSMPKYAAQLEIGCGSAAAFTDAMARQVLHNQGQFKSLTETRHSFSRYEEEWLDNSLRRRVRFYDVYYKQPKQVLALIAGDKRVAFNQSNPLHVAMVERGMGMLVKGMSYQMRHARFAGPFRLFDKPRASRRFPLIPFVGFTDDEFGTPYGMVQCMISPQDEYNERRSRLRWLLKAAQVFVDEDALAEKFNNFRDLAREVMRPDSVFVLNKGRKNANGLRIEHNLQLAAEQVEVMNDAKTLIQEVPRIYSSMLGDAPKGVTSGLAINSLVEQGMVAMGETNDNYRGSRAAVGDALSQLIVEDLARPNMRVLLGKARSSRVVVLNTFDEEQLPLNHVEDAPLNIGLGDVPSTPAHKLQQQQHLSQLAQAVGPDPVARSVILPELIESTDMPNREEKARWMRQQYGVPDGGVTDPKAEAAAAEQKNQALQMQLEQAQAELADLKASTAQKESVAELNQVKAGELMQRMTAPPEPQPMPAANDDDLLRASIAR